MIRSPFDIPAANECNECHGRGYTDKTSQIIKPTSEGPVTTAQGSGCPECFGTGRLLDE